MSTNPAVHVAGGTRRDLDAAVEDRSLDVIETILTQPRNRKSGPDDVLSVPIGNGKRSRGGICVVTKRTRVDRCRCRKYDIGRRHGANHGGPRIHRRGIARRSATGGRRNNQARRRGCYDPAEFARGIDRQIVRSSRGQTRSAATGDDNAGGRRALSKTFIG